MDDPSAALTYTVEETAKRLRISLAKCYQLTQDGTLPTVRFGRAVRVPKAALDKWIERETSA